MHNDRLLLIALVLLPGLAGAQDSLRGHNVFWGISNRVQPWLKTMSDDELRTALKARALDVATRYRGRFPEARRVSL